MTVAPEPLDNSTTASDPSTTMTPRARARTAFPDDILQAARRQLATEGAAGLSLRAVARELGVASSAVYRYVASRDELLTHLIVTAYNELGEAAETAAATDGSPRQRWLATAHAIRNWALTHPNDYALLYGTPVPGYAAPDTNNTAGTRASLALVSIVNDACDPRAITASPERATPQERIDPLDAEMSAELEDLAERINFSGPPGLLLDVLCAWSQLYGLISFELFGQTRNLVTDNERLFIAATTRMADSIGL